MQKPEGLTTFVKADCINNNYHDIKNLTPAINGQYLPADRGKGNWISNNAHMIELRGESLIKDRDNYKENKILN